MLQQQSMNNDPYLNIVDRTTEIRNIIGSLISGQGKCGPFAVDWQYMQCSQLLTEKYVYNMLDLAKIFTVDFFVFLKFIY